MLYDSSHHILRERERGRERDGERDAALVFRVVDKAEKTVSKLL